MLRGRRLRLALLGAAVALTGAAIAFYFVSRPPGDISNPGVDFVEPTATPQPDTRKGSGRDRRRADQDFVWPVYGFTNDHRRVYDPPRRLSGPWTIVWKRKAPALLEFPPVIARGSIVQLAGNGEVRAMDKDTGETRWRRRLGTLAASSPAVHGRTLYVTLLETRGSRRGRIAALRLGDGRIRWSRTLPSRSESSPIVHGGKVYFGTENGTVYALRTKGGGQVWTYRAGGAVKASLALADGRLYFGDYGGSVHAIRTVNGQRVWTSPAARGGLRSGTFYATAALAFGRVYIGSTDGRMYSLSARNGQVAWARQTGRYVYSSAAVQDVPRLGPTVYFGSYDGRFYALDARSGRTRWTFESGGRISGSPTIIGGTVYFSDLGKERTFGLNTRTGKRVLRRDGGGYDPAISDGRHLFLTNQGSLVALRPRRAVAAERRRARAERRREARRERDAEARERRRARRDRDR